MGVFPWLSKTGLGWHTGPDTSFAGTVTPPALKRYGGPVLSQSTWISFSETNFFWQVGLHFKVFASILTSKICYPNSSCTLKGKNSCFIIHSELSYTATHIHPSKTLLYMFPLHFPYYQSQQSFPHICYKFNLQEVSNNFVIRILSFALNSKQY